MTYPIALDTGAGNGTLYADLFTPDGVFVSDTVKHQGREALKKFAWQHRPGQGPLYVRNYSTNPWIEASPEGATGKVYALVLDVGENGGPNTHHRRRALRRRLREDRAGLADQEASVRAVKDAAAAARAGARRFDAAAALTRGLGHTTFNAVRAEHAESSSGSCSAASVSVAGRTAAAYSIFRLYVVSAFRRTVVVRLKPDTTYKS